MNQRQTLTEREDYIPKKRTEKKKHFNVHDKTTAGLLDTLLSCLDEQG